MSASGTRLRSQLWFHDLGDPDSTAIHIERYMNFGNHPGGAPSRGARSSGSPSPGATSPPATGCTLRLAERVQAGVRAAGGVPARVPGASDPGDREAPPPRPSTAISPISASSRCCTDTPSTGVVLTTGCDKTTPSQAHGRGYREPPRHRALRRPDARRLVPGAAHRLRHRPLGGAQALRGRRESTTRSSSRWWLRRRSPTASCKHDGHRVHDELARRGARDVPCPSARRIPAPYKERGQIAYETGRRIVDLVREDVTPSKIMTREAFENVIVANSAIGGGRRTPRSTSTPSPATSACPSPSTTGSGSGTASPCSSTCSRPATISAKATSGRAGCRRSWASCCASGKAPLRCNHRERADHRRELFRRRVGRPRRDSAPSTIPPQGRRGLRRAQGQPVRRGGDEDLGHRRDLPPALPRAAGARERRRGAGHRLRGPGGLPPSGFNDPSLEVDENCFLVIRGCGPVGYPGSAEVVNMQPPDELIRRGIRELPTNRGRSPERDPRGAPRS